MRILPPHPSARTASLVLLFSASWWGLSWWPLKQFGQAGLSGPHVTMLSYGLVGLASLVVLWRQWPQWRHHWGWVLALATVGGWANASFVNALMAGDVVRVMFLFYLSPVWAVLGGWFFLKEKVPPLRWMAVAVAVVGLWLVLVPGSAGQTTAWHDLGLADGLALSAGLAFAANNILARAASNLALGAKTFSVFVGCSVLSGLAVLWTGEPMPTGSPGVWLGLLAYGFGGLLLATVTWQYGVTHLDASRAGIILLAELVVAVGTAVWWGDAQLTALGWVGGLMIAAAALLEATGTPGTPVPASALEKGATP